MRICQPERERERGSAKATVPEPSGNWLAINDDSGYLVEDKSVQEGLEAHFLSK